VTHRRDYFSATIILARFRITKPATETMRWDSSVASTDPLIPKAGTSS
jgi:hypothetical protein